MTAQGYSMLDPTAESSPVMRERRAPPEDLDRATIGLLCISKERSEEFLDTLEQRLAARGNIAKVAEPRLPGSPAIRVPNVVPRLTGTPGRIDTLGPPLGAHTADVLKDWLGLAAPEIDALRQAGAV